MSESDGSSGACVYLICAIIKLLVISSPTCLNMLVDNEKLKPKVDSDSEPATIGDEDTEGISEEATEESD